MGGKIIDALKEAVSLSPRYAHLMSNPPRCPACGEEQVQLFLFKHDPPAKWRCRICKHRFEAEPEARPTPNHGQEQG